MGSRQQGQVTGYRAYLLQASSVDPLSLVQNHPAHIVPNHTLDLRRYPSLLVGEPLRQFLDAFRFEILQRATPCVFPLRPVRLMYPRLT